MKYQAQKPAMITLLTDFGLQDAFVAEMKGVILARVPQARLVDITHDIPPFQIETAARMLGQAYRFFPPGTIHIAVVDPGVGGNRKPLLIKTGGFFFIGPDNGVFTSVVNREKHCGIYTIHTSDQRISPTFHGRDIFAPVAAAIAAGEKIENLGTKQGNILLLADMEAKCVAAGKWQGKIAAIDRFGNLSTNIREKALLNMTKPCLQIGKTRITNFIKTFCHGVRQKPGIIINSDGFLEISVYHGSAKKVLKTHIGKKVLLYNQ
ncbi:SAM-dependent chlorinase/fluorinase [candidate division FCPU426 bacterium]|nr:SAM-dependent chlorinase/fluorinase [candidate division FCPU426 bacterium]